MMWPPFMDHTRSNGPAPGIAMDWIAGGHFVSTPRIKLKHMRMTDCDY